MKFTVLSISLVPDTELGQRLYKLEDLDEKGISKILFHKRKQETGHTEELRLPLQRVASLTALTCHRREVTLRTRTMPEHDETKTLAGLFDTARGSDHLVTWSGGKLDLPLLRYRAMQRKIRSPKFWRKLADDAGFHLDLSAELFGDNERARTGLDQLAVSMGLPGLMQAQPHDPWQKRLAGDIQALREHTELEALNLHLLALRNWWVSGGMDRKAVKQAETALHDWLTRSKTPHLRRFLDHWVRD